MKKLNVLIPTLLAGVALAGCALTSSTDGTTPSMAKEVASLSLFSNNATVSAQSLQKAALNAVATALPFGFSSVESALASFENLSFSVYKVTIESSPSDRAEYLHKDTIAYTLPSGESSTAVLYYGDVAVSESTDATASASSESGSSDATLPSSLSEKKGDKGSKGDFYLHCNGYGDGSCDELLNGSSFAKEEGTLTYDRFEGLAVVDGAEYTFYAENKTGTRKGKTFDRSSFSILYSESDYLTVEEAAVSDSNGTRNVYVYTSFINGSKKHFLLDDNANCLRFVYKTDTDKAAINRFVYDGVTYFTVHMKQAGTMSLVGVYKKVETTAEDGTVSVSYEKVAVSTFTHAPHEK